MKSIFKTIMLGTFLMLFMYSYTQEDTKMTKDQRRAEKEQKKKDKEEKEAADWLIYQKLAQDKEFVIRFDKVANRVVSQRLNFLYADGENIILQFETNTYLSENGLGGRTINGTISNYKYIPPKNDKKPIYINFDITSKFDQKNFNISVTIYGGGTAIISMGSGVSVINGFISPIEDANINMGVDMRN